MGPRRCRAPAPAPRTRARLLGFWGRRDGKVALREGRVLIKGWPVILGVRAPGEGVAGITAVTQRGDLSGDDGPDLWDPQVSGTQLTGESERAGCGAAGEGRQVGLTGGVGLSVGPVHDAG
jgi:hypothetical protein